MGRTCQRWMRFWVIVIVVCWSQVAIATSNPAARHPLAPPPTDSPRATLTAFLSDTERAYDLLMSAEAQSKQDPGWAHSPAVLEQGKQAAILMQRAVRTINLAHLPAANRQQEGLESALMLKEILDRIELPPSDQIPGPEAIKQQNTLKRWVIPYTEIELLKGQDGQYSEAFLFSSTTQQQIPDFYRKVKDLPYRSSGTKGFYEFYVRTPGSLLPPKWSLWLPAWSSHIVQGQTVWQWLGLGLLGCLSLGIFSLVKFLRRVYSRAFHAKRLCWLRLLDPACCGLTIFFIEFSLLNIINVSGEVYELLSVLMTTLQFLVATWFVYLFIIVLAEVLITSPHLEKRGIDASLVRTIFQLLAILAAATVLYLGAQQLGIPVAPLLASFGALTLAMGVGAQEYFKNIVGGLTLFIDRPVRVGDLCEFGGIVGIVEEIGLRSTRIRTLERTLVSVPNVSFSTSQLVNYSQRDQYELRVTLGLRYETTHGQIQQVLRQVHSFLEQHPWVSPEVLVRLASLGDSSINIDVCVYLRTVTRPEFFRLREEILLAMMQIVEQAGAEFAFPSQTLYLAQDSSTEPEGDEGSSQVAEVATTAGTSLPQVSGAVS